MRVDGGGSQAGLAQRRLAEEVTRFVHGEEGLQQALAATAVRSVDSQIAFTMQISGNLNTLQPPAAATRTILLTAPGCALCQQHRVTSWC